MNVRHHNRLLAVLRTILLVVLLPFMAGAAPIDQETNPDSFSRNYRWMYNKQLFKLQLDFPWDAYNYYADQHRFYGNYAIYTYEHPAHMYLDDVTEALTRKAKAHHFNSWETIEFITAFVQQLSYVNEVGEYPKFPLETLAAKGGDCEDTSILLAALLRKLGYDIMLVNPPGHMGVALACKDCEGAAYQINGRRYFYIETTGPGFAVGEIPKEYKTTRDKFYPLQAPVDKLWVLSTQSRKSKSAGIGYYIREDDATSMARGNGGECVLTTRKMRSVTVNGETKTTSSVLRWMRE